MKARATEAWTVVTFYATKIIFNVMLLFHSFCIEKVQLKICWHLIEMSSNMRKILKILLAFNFTNFTKLWQKWLWGKFRKCDCYSKEIITPHEFIKCKLPNLRKYLSEFGKYCASSHCLCLLILTLNKSHESEVINLLFVISDEYFSQKQLINHFQLWKADWKRIN